ncbi:MAG: DUF1634 domain-containing protein [Anaerolineae bacterium]
MTDDVRVSARSQPVGEQATEPAASSSPPRQPVAATYVRPLAADVERRDLNEAVHKILIIGLTASTILLLVGVLLGVIEQRPMPNTTLAVGDVVQRLVGMRPSGFLNLGLLVLIVTPVMRVIGSVFVFLFERDWRYAAITGLVLVIMLISLLSGRAG